VIGRQSEGTVSLYPHQRSSRSDRREQRWVPWGRAQSWRRL